MQAYRSLNTFAGPPEDDEVAYLHEVAFESLAMLRARLGDNNRDFSSPDPSRVVNRQYVWESGRVGRGKRDAAHKE